MRLATSHGQTADDVTIAADRPLGGITVTIENQVTPQRIMTLLDESSEPSS